MISHKGELLFQGWYSAWPDEELVVEADGLGGANLLIVQGNYPIDYLVRKSKSFLSEDEACAAADEMLAGTYR